MPHNLLHFALCLQIIQAFSHIVAAGSAWRSALLLLDEVAADLQTGTDPKEGPALVSRSTSGYCCGRMMK